MIAARQYGLVESSQLQSLGIDRHVIRRKVASGELERVLPRVYRLSGAPRCWRQRLLAACLWGGPQAVASHRSAAALLGLEGFSLGPVEGQDAGPVEITTPKRNQSHLAVSVHQSLPDRCFVVTVDGIRVTNASRTLIDLAPLVDRTVLERALDDALRRGLTTLRQLRWTIAKVFGPGRRGPGVLRDLLDERLPLDGPSASEFQKDVRAVLREEGLPFQEEFEIWVDGQCYRVDFGSPDHPVVVEADGRRDHSSREDWERDLRRRNRITSAGYWMIHVTPGDLAERREGFIREVKGALAASGWVLPGGVSAGPGAPAGPGPAGAPGAGRGAGRRGRNPGGARAVL